MFKSRFIGSKVPVLLAAIVFLLPQSVEAQSKAKPQSKEAVADPDGYILRTYDLTDLVMQVPEYHYPGNRHAKPAAIRGTGVGGMGGGMFGRMISPTPASGTKESPSNPHRITLDALVSTLQSFVAPHTWTESEWDMVRVLDSTLIVRQTPAVHSQIQGFLKQFRTDSSRQKIISIDARWLLLNSDDLDRLIVSTPSDDGLPVVDRKMLAEYTRRPSSIRAITNCFTGQLVYLVSGTRRNVITSYIPVVGGTSVGYQPQIEKTNLGTLLEIRATLIPNGNRAVVDLRSTITMPAEWRTDAEQFAGQIAQHPLAPTVDRVATETQQLATTLSMPLRQPVLAGGITYATPLGNAPNKSVSPQAPVSEEAPQLYLILELR